jgi:hypothetical protein
MGVQALTQSDFGEEVTPPTDHSTSTSSHSIGTAPGKTLALALVLVLVLNS